MSKQIQIQRTPVKRTETQASAPTVNRKLAKLWFGGQS